MTYKETIDFLFSQLPVFQREGASAYKPGLETVRRLAGAFGNPHDKLKCCIHVAGTNGKGSVAHTLAAILQSAGYRTGLFTSPHLVDFRERIRVDGEMIPESEVVDFVREYRRMPIDASPSFFELTTVMAFDYFVREQVDVAIVEVGLGGRLDSTNVITPVLSVITNISLDHTSLLGSTPEAIASEKAGIMKPGVPVVIGESCGAVRDVFAAKAHSLGAPVVYADDCDELLSASHDDDDGWTYRTRDFGCFKGELGGLYQIANTHTVLEAVKMLRRTGVLNIPEKSVAQGFGSVCRLTGLMGRWTVLSQAPFTVCDTGHNPGGWTYLSRQLKALKGVRHIVLGFVNDKDVKSVLAMLADMERVRFYFTQPSTPRALPCEELGRLAHEAGLEGGLYATVASAYECALADVIDKSADSVFVGGSTFVVSDLFSHKFGG